MNDVAHDDPGPFGDEPEEEPAPEQIDEPVALPEPEKPYNIWGLRNSKAVDMDRLAEELDFDKSPGTHVLTGLSKQLGTDGPEAWMHYAVALVLFMDAEYEILPNELRETQTAEEPERRGERWEEQ